MLENFDKRLDFFIDLCYSSKRWFCEEIDITPQHLQAYVTQGREPTFDMLGKFMNGGLSIDWILTCAGNMFAHNPIGNSLRQTVRKKLLLQIVYTHTGSNDFTKEAFLENFERFSCLLGRDDAAYSLTIEMINSGDVKEFYYPSIKQHVFGIDISESLINSVFDIEFVSLNQAFIRQIAQEWIPNRPVPAHIPLAIWDGIDYSSFSVPKRNFRKSIPVLGVE